MSDERLREILGFDPETGGDYTQHRISRSRLQTPEDISDNFAVYARSGRDPKTGAFKFSPVISSDLKDVIVHPQQLLLVSKHRFPQIYGDIVGDFVYRNYYSHEIASDSVEFTERAKTEFVEVDGRFHPLGVFLFGEDRAWQSASIRFLNYFGQEESVRPMIRCCTTIDGRTLDIFYNEDGTIVFLGIAVGTNWSTRAIVLKTEHFAWYPGIEMESFLKAGDYRTTSQEGKDYFQANYDQTTGIIELIREESEEAKDQLVIPTSINRGEIIAKLFPQLLLNDPYMAFPEADDDWKFADLLATVGIKWERS